MRDTRWAILNALKIRGRATIKQLAEFTQVKPITVRHHLKTLQADGLVWVEAEHQQVGRPRYVYSLTEEAQSLFPHKYHLLAERLLDQLKGTLPSEMVETVLDQIALVIAEEIRPDLEGLPLEERVDLVVRVLSREGFLAHWEHTADGFQLIEYHCPYYLISRDHPEICRIGETLIRVALDTEVSKTACLVDGDENCSFRILAASSGREKQPETEGT